MLIGGFTYLVHASKPASLGHSMFPQTGQLLRNTRNLGSTSPIVLKLPC